MWLKINHPEAKLSSAFTGSLSLSVVLVDYSSKKAESIPSSTSN